MKGDAAALALRLQQLLAEREEALKDLKASLSTACRPSGSNDSGFPITLHHWSGPTTAAQAICCATTTQRCAMATALSGDPRVQGGSLQSFSLRVSHLPHIALLRPASGAGLVMSLATAHSGPSMRSLVDCGACAKPLEPKTPLDFCPQQSVSCVDRLSGSFKSPVAYHQTQHVMSEMRAAMQVRLQGVRGSEASASQWLRAVFWLPLV